MKTLRNKARETLATKQSNQGFGHYALKVAEFTSDNMLNEFNQFDLFGDIEIKSNLIKRQFGVRSIRHSTILSMSVQEFNSLVKLESNVSDLDLKASFIYNSIPGLKGKYPFSRIKILLNDAFVE